MPVHSTDNNNRASAINKTSEGYVPDLSNGNFEDAVSSEQHGGYIRDAIKLATSTTRIFEREADTSYWPRLEEGLLVKRDSPLANLVRLKLPVLSTGYRSVVVNHILEQYLKLQTFSIPTLTF
ncbi:MAG: hypothetical protein J3R72DRAFT_486968 [Linnemannia gamsii]|nr:MAG: hypothetical protein J3R72DRAFT_486968 [Linnemannia gamsii]